MICASALLTASALLLPAASASAADDPSVSPGKLHTHSGPHGPIPPAPGIGLITELPKAIGSALPPFPAVGLESKVEKLPVPEKKDSVGEVKDLYPRAKAYHYFPQRKWISGGKGGAWLKAGSFEASFEKFPPGYRFTKIKKTITGWFVYAYGIWEPARRIDPGSVDVAFYQDERTDLWVLADNFVRYNR